MIVGQKKKCWVTLGDLLSWMGTSLYFRFDIGRYIKGRNKFEREFFRLQKCVPSVPQRSQMHVHDVKSFGSAFSIFYSHWMYIHPQLNSVVKKLESQWESIRMQQQSRAETKK